MIHRLLPALLLSAVLLSCGKTSDGVEIQNWNFGGRPNLMVWLRHRTASFEQTHPGFRVSQTDKSWNMIREILYASFTTGTGPDVVNTHANYAAEFGEAGHYLAVNQFPDFDSVRSWYLPEMIAATEYKGKCYGLPSSGIAFVLVCNRDLFEAEGIAAPRTWSEFRAAAKRLTKDTDGDGKTDQYGLVLMGGNKGGFAYRMIPFFYKAGVDFMTGDLTRVAFDAPMGVATLGLFADMFQKDRSIAPGFLAYDHTETNDMFSCGKAAMCIEGPWVKGMVHAKNPTTRLMIVPVPVPDAMIDRYETAPTLQDVVMYAISARSKHPEVAWEFIKYLRNEEADMAWVREDMGGLATTLAALGSPEAQKIEHLPLFVHELRNARPLPPHPKIVALASNSFTPWCQKAIVGEVTPAEALSRAAREVQAVIEGNR